MCKTTVIIPNYNGIKYLSDCLSFLKRSRTYKKGEKINEMLLPEHHFHTIVVDNGSTDESVELIRQEFPWVELITLSQNYGFCKAVNEGILAAKTPYVLLLNNDTKVDPFMVSRLEQAIEKKAGYFSIGAKILSMQEPEKIDDAGDLYCALGWAFALGKGASSGLYEKDYDVFAACACAAIYRREIFAEIGLFDEYHFAYLEDIDIGYRAKIYGYRNGICHEALVYHAGSGFSGSRYNQFKVSHSSRNSVYLVYKNMPILQLLLNLPFLLVGYLIKTAFFIKKGMGITYLAGLWRGLCMCFQKKTRKRHIPFHRKHFLNYVEIQLKLWLNLLRRIIG